MDRTTPDRSSFQPPSWRAVTRLELRLLTLVPAHRGTVRVFTMFAVAVAIVVLVVLAMQARMTLAPDAGAEPLLVPAGLTGFVVVYPFLVAAALLLPGWVWRDASPSRRAYHHAMPVERCRHDLLRVLAGAVGLAFAVAAAIIYMVVIAAVSGDVSKLGALSPWAWLNLLLGPILAYALGSVPTLRSDRPGRWTLLAGLATVMLWALAWLFESPVRSVFTALFDGPLGLSRALGGALFADALGRGARDSGLGWFLAFVLWASVATVLLWLSARRPPP